MINLSVGQKLYGKSTVSNVLFTLSGYTTSGSVQAYSTLAQGFFQIPVKELFVATAQTIISDAYLHNESADTTSFELYINTPNLSGLIYQATLESGWSASLTDKGWAVYDQNGLPVINSGCTNITVSSTPPLSPSMGQLWVQI